MSGASFHAIGGLTVKTRVDEHGSASIKVSRMAYESARVVETSTVNAAEVAALAKRLMDMSDEMESRVKGGRR